MIDMNPFIRKTVLVILFLAAMIAQAEDSLPLYRCYSRLRVQGALENVDLALDRISRVVTIESRIHRVVQDSQIVEVESIASMTGLDRDDVKSKVSKNGIQTYLSVIKTPLAGAEIVFLGCSETQLKP